MLAAVVDGTGRVLDTEATATPGPGPGSSGATVAEVEDALVEVVEPAARPSRPLPGRGRRGRLRRPRTRSGCGSRRTCRGATSRCPKRLDRALRRPDPGRRPGRQRRHRGPVGRGALRRRARRRADAVMVTLGTGIGGGADGARRRCTAGSNGMAGEFGHMQVVPDGRPCECGRRGCWEQYCSGRALARAAAEGGLRRSPARRSRPRPARATRSRWRRTPRSAHWLGVGVANLVAAFDPPLVVIGGGVSAAGDLLLEPARVALAKSLVGAGFRDLPRPGRGRARPARRRRRRRRPRPDGRPDQARR